MKQQVLWCGVAMAALVTTLNAAEETWELDPAHTQAGFSIRHLMATNVKGSVTGAKGWVKMDADKPEAMKLEATLEAKTIQTGDAKRDEHLKGGDFFDVKKNPTITFKSKSATKSGDNEWKIVGDLTLHGVTKEVTLENATFSPAVKDPWGNTKRGFSAKTKINRQDFGITWNKALDGGGVVVGNDVTIEVDAELAPKATKQATQGDKTKKG